MKETYVILDSTVSREKKSLVGKFLQLLRGLCDSFRLSSETKFPECSDLKFCLCARPFRLCLLKEATVKCKALKSHCKTAGWPGGEGPHAIYLAMS